MNKIVSVNTKPFTTTDKRSNFDLVAVGTCPHDDGRLDIPLPTKGIGVTAKCLKCERTWYLNRTIRTCKCVTCSHDRKQKKHPLDTHLADNYNTFCAEVAQSVEQRTENELPNSKLFTNYDLLLTEFLDSRRQGLSPRTIGFYKGYLFRSKQVLSPATNGQHITYFLKSLKCTAGGKHAYYRALKAFYNWLYSPKSGYKLNAQNNPVLNIDPPKLDRKILPSLTLQQLNYLIEQANCIRDKSIISLFADSGLRLSELANIDPQNIDWEHKLIKVNCKGNKEGLAVFGERTECLLKEWLAQYEPNGRLWDINHNGISIMLRRLMSRTGLPCNPHTFRRTFASILAKKGIDSLHIKRLGRWESMQMVERYTASVRFEDSLKLYTAIVSKK